MFAAGGYAQPSTAAANPEPAKVELAARQRLRAARAIVEANLQTTGWSGEHAYPCERRRSR